MGSGLAGVNLRQEDLAQFEYACQQAGVKNSDVPVLYIVHDDTAGMLTSSLHSVQVYDLNVAAYRCMAFNSQLTPPALPQDAHIIGWNEADDDTAGMLTSSLHSVQVYDLNVAAYRCMAFNSQLTPPALPQDAHIIGWNEADDDSAYPNLPGWVDPWWQHVRSIRPDLRIHYGAPNVDGYLLENAPLEAALDCVDRHIGSTFGPPSRVQGKPTWVTEVDIDPSRFDYTSPSSMDDAYDELLACMTNCVNANVPVFAWGILPDRPDAAYSSKVIEAIVAMNTVDPKTAAERAYNTMAGGQPFIPGQRYVQDNGNGSYTAVVTYMSLATAQGMYNIVTGGLPFVAGKRYVQDNGDTTYSVVVTY